MCLAVPGKIMQIDGQSMADVVFGNVVRQVSLRLVPDAKEGDYIIMHAGFAIQLLDEQDAMETLKLFKELAQYESE